MSKNQTRWIDAVACILLMLVFILLHFEMAPRYAKQLVSLSMVRQTEKTAETKETIDFAALKKKNPDIYAWLEIPGTEISYPLLQHGEDDGFYLSHDFIKQPDPAGSLFTENTYNGTDFSDPVTVIYGNSMPDGSMLGSMQMMYADAEEFAKHSEIVVYLPERELHFFAFAALPFSQSHLLSGRSFENPRTFRDFFEQILETRTIGGYTDPTFAVAPGDHVLLLSTCLKGNSEKRYLVCAKLAEKAPQPTAQGTAQKEQTATAISALSSTEEIIAQSPVPTSFVPSITAQNMPPIVSIRSQSGEMVNALVRDASGTETAAVTEAELLVTSLADAENAPADIKAALTSAYNDMTTQPLHVLSEALPDYLEEYTDGVTEENLVVHDLFDVTMQGAGQEAFEKQGSTVTVQFDLNLEEDTFFAAMTNHDILGGGDWEIVSQKQITRMEDGDVCITFDRLCPIVFLTDSAPEGDNAGGPLSPQTDGETRVGLPWGWIAVAVAVMLLPVLIWIRKKRAEEEDETRTK